MALPNAYAQYVEYNNNKILNATPAELTLMLYDGAIKFCNVAILGIEQKNIQKAHNNIVKVEKIIQYLRETLDMKYPVAQEFENIYVYVERRLVEANTKKDKEIVEEVCMHMRSLRDTWVKVMQVTKGNGAV